MTTECSIDIVNGYHAVTPVSVPAKAAGLNYRFSVVLGTYNPSLNYIYFQDAVFLDLINHLSETIDYEKINIEFDDNLKFQSIETLSNHLSEIPQEDRLPPHRILFYKRGNLVCVEETEFWANCGGQPPYSDSYTAAFYTGEDKAEVFLAACKTAIKNYSQCIESIIQASKVPVKLPIWKRLFGSYG